MKRAVLYLRVSTDGQTTDNQRLALSALAEQRGWTVVETYNDNGISGAKGRDKRPGLDRMLKDANARQVRRGACVGPWTGSAGHSPTCCTR